MVHEEKKRKQSRLDQWHNHRRNPTQKSDFSPHFYLPQLFGSQFHQFLAKEGRLLFLVDITRTEYKELRIGRINIIIGEWYLTLSCFCLFIVVGGPIITSLVN